jgi:inositol transport system ATP-binding protein
VTETLLSIQGITKSFPGIKALDDVSFEVRPGTVHALCRENGAGKSTLMKIINGIYQSDEGIIRVRGEECGSRIRSTPVTAASR